MNEVTVQSQNLTTKIQEPTGIHILPFLIVALLWGSTDVLIAQASVQKKQDFSPLDFSPVNLIKFVLKKRIWIWICINQIGSVIYAFLLGIYPQEYSLIWANCLTVFISFMLQKFIHFYKLKKGSRFCKDLKQKGLNQSKTTKKQVENMIGIFLIMIGIYLMII